MGKQRAIRWPVIGLLFGLGVSACSDQTTTELAAVFPTQEALSVGLAGHSPPDVSRYLLASGVSGAKLSPDGKQVVYRSSVTGVPQLWTLPLAGGAPRQMTFGNGITFFRWMPDSTGLIYGADNDGDE